MREEIEDIRVGSPCFSGRDSKGLGFGVIGVWIVFRDALGGLCLQQGSGFGCPTAVLVLGVDAVGLRPQVFPVPLALVLGAASLNRGSASAVNEPDLTRRSEVQIAERVPCSGVAHLVLRAMKRSITNRAERFRSWVSDAVDGERVCIGVLRSW